MTENNQNSEELFSFYEEYLWSWSMLSFWQKSKPENVAWWSKWIKILDNFYSVLIVKSHFESNLCRSCRTVEQLCLHFCWILSGFLMFVRKLFRSLRMRLVFPSHTCHTKLLPAKLMQPVIHRSPSFMCFRFVQRCDSPQSSSPSWA